MPACVRSQMFGQCGTVGERFVAMGTGIGTFAGVGSFERELGELRWKFGLKII